MDGTLLSLQDICKLTILFNMESFPDSLLSQLPRYIRIRLFKSLPIFDRLHYENAQFCCDFDTEDICQSPATAENRIKEKLVRRLFAAEHVEWSAIPTELKDGCGINLEELSNFIGFLTIGDAKYKAIQRLINYLKHFLPCKILSAKPIPAIRWGAVEMNSLKANNPIYDYIVIPNRFMEFLTVDEPEDSIYSTSYIGICKAPMFASYCNLNAVRTLHAFTVDTIQLVNSPIWREYTSIRNSFIKDSQPLSSLFTSATSTVVNPISPFVQDILASVEHLSIGTNEEFEPTNDDEYLSIDAPNFILTNIVSREKPHLKSIHIHGIARTVIDAVITIGAFLCGVEDCPVTGINNRYTFEGDEYSLVPPSKPYYIEELYISAGSGKKKYTVQYLLAYHAAIVSNTVKNILCHQRKSLKCLSLKGLGFTYDEMDTSNLFFYESSCFNKTSVKIVNCDEYRSLLNTTLVDFVQLPQFVSLELGDSPDTECYPLILAFMTTPTSHEQKLVISLSPDSKPTISDWCEQYPIPTALPHSNIQFKSLVLKGKHSPLLDQLFSFPDLSLNSLHLSTVHLMGKLPSKVNIGTIRLLIESEQLDTAKLDVFISQNISLTSLKLERNFKTPFRSFFESVNECLLRILLKKGTLDSIHLKKVDLSNCIFYCTPPSFAGSDEEGYDFTKWMPSQAKEGKMDLATWFTSFSHQSTDTPVEMTKNEFVLFLCLVQKLNSSVTITSSSRNVPVVEAKHLEFLISTLENIFEKTNAKIREMTLVDNQLKECEASFKRIASSVIISNVKVD